jgi:hypothetical protein
MATTLTPSTTTSQYRGVSTSYRRRAIVRKALTLVAIYAAMLVVAA